MADMPAADGCAALTPCPFRLTIVTAITNVMRQILPFARKDRGKCSGVNPRFWRGRVKGPFDPNPSTNLGGGGKGRA